MTNETTAVPRPGAGVSFEIRDTRPCSNETANRTAVEREQDTERDTPERDTLHAHERDNPEPFDPSTMVRCRDYHAHQTGHRRAGDGWTCDRCNEVNS